MRVIWMDFAQEQLEEIHGFLAKRNIRAATDVYNDIIDAVDKLCHSPKMAAVEPLLADEKQTCRSLVVRQNWKAVYRIIDGEIIQIIAIIDCRRNPSILRRILKKQL